VKLTSSIEPAERQTNLGFAGVAEVSNDQGFSQQL
jgi:hypothetical protein